MAHEKFVSIQWLRALAALLVLAFHLLKTLSLHGYESLNLGVELFFCLSGCVMQLSISGRSRGPRAAIRFMRRRVIRVVPLYWTFLSLYIFEVYPGLRGGIGRPGLRITWASYALLFVKTTGAGWSGDGVQFHFPLLSVGWTLTFEMFFYLCFAITIAFSCSSFWVAPPLIFMALIGPQSKASWPAMAALFSPRLLSFIGGLLVGQLTLKKHYLPVAFAWIVLPAFCVLLLVFRQQSSTSQYWSLVVAANLLVAALLSIENEYRPKPKLFAALGDASYVLYLSHPLLLHSVESAVRGNKQPTGNLIVIFVIATLVCCYVAMLLHLWVELPLIGWLNVVAGDRKPLVFDSSG